MSLYADYLKEKTGHFVLEIENGFASYKYLDDGKTVYIIDIYVRPEFRKTKIASTIADSIVEIAVKNGCNSLLGTIMPSNKGSTTSLKFLLSYGMHLDSSANDLIVLRKEI